MREDLEQRAEELAVYIIENRTTIRAAAKHFGVSKSTVHKDLSERLEACNRALYQQAKKILDQNKAERHIRGGNATRDKYKKARNSGPSLPGEQERDTDDRWIKEGYVTLTVLGYDCGVYSGEPITEKEFFADRI